MAITCVSRWNPKLNINTQHVDHVNVLQQLRVIENEKAKKHNSCRITNSANLNSMRVWQSLCSWLVHMSNHVNHLALRCIRIRNIVRDTHTHNSHLERKNKCLNLPEIIWGKKTIYAHTTDTNRHTSDRVAHICQLVRMSYRFRYYSECVCCMWWHSPNKWVYFSRGKFLCFLLVFGSSTRSVSWTFFFLSSFFVIWNVLLSFFVIFGPRKKWKLDYVYLLSVSTVVYVQIDCGRIDRCERERERAEDGWKREKLTGKLLHIWHLWIVIIQFGNT